ncbi:hypothetical protein K456DRAFT_416695 [Colletotrichum gloeosporioides 23]|nr:hypothetical protein K456DRAFT_416695 [Colletotrichum gloeosporioides 23]
MAGRKKRCTESPRTDAIAEFDASSQATSAAIQSDSLTLLSQLLAPESTRSSEDGMQFDGSQPEEVDTHEDKGTLTTTSTAGGEAAVQTMDGNSPAVSAPSMPPAYTGASRDGCLRDAVESVATSKAYCFDSRGDLILKVGEAFHKGGSDFVVCSRTVARWSKVFNAMLFGGFAESIPSSRHGTWTVALPEDRIPPVFLVLAIIHGPYLTIPTVLGRDELCELLIVTEKYDMKHILGPWASKWFENLPRDDSENTTGEHRDVWIAWELGHEVGFCRILKDMLFHCRVDDAGQLLDVHGVPLLTLPCLEPSSILENMSIIRAELVEKSLGHARRVIQKYVAGGCCLGDHEVIRHSCDIDFNDRSDFISRENCDDLFLGSLVRRIRDVGLEEFVLPLATSSSYLGSIDDSSNLFEGEIIEGYVNGHDLCDPWVDI